MKRVRRHTEQAAWPGEVTLHCCSPPLLSTGGTVLAAEVALQRGLACSTAGGTHHAFPGYGSGFCLLNDLAVAAKYLVDESVTKRKVLIVDLDVHQVELSLLWTKRIFRVAKLDLFLKLVLSIQQGDGTAFIFKEEPCVFTFSVHCGKNFPVRKQQSDLDVSVDDGMEDKEYLSTGMFIKHRISMTFSL